MFESSENPDLAGSEERASYVYGWAVEELEVIVFLSGFWRCSGGRFLLVEGNFHSILVLLDCMEGTSEEFVEWTEAVRR